MRSRARQLDLVDSSGTVSVAVGVEVTGIPTDHDNEHGTINGANLMYKFTLGGLRFVHMGDFGQDALTPAQREAIGPVDVLFIPVGGVTTIDAGRARALVDELKPSVVFPMHYGDIRFYRLAPVATFLSYFPDNQKKNVDGSSVRLRRSDLTPQNVVYKLLSTNRN